MLLMSFETHCLKVGGGGCSFLFSLDTSKKSGKCQKIVKDAGWMADGKGVGVEKSCDYVYSTDYSEECEKIAGQVLAAHDCMAL